MLDPYLHKTVTQIVRDNYRTAGVFKKFGINYCCGGAVSLAEACAIKNLATEELKAELKEVAQPIRLPANLQYNNWKLDFLVDYIVNVHHAYLKDALPKLEANLNGFVNSHRKKMPYLDNIFAEFQTLAALLQQQMEQEESVLFPYIKQVEAAHRRNETYGGLLVKTLRKPLHKEDAVSVGNALFSLRRLTNQYQFSEDACTNHRVVFQQLEEMDNDLVQHKHLENNILFPA